MQSSLKKSLYLGLAALSFVSVAGAANANNASAKRTHHARVARKAFNPDNQGMDQSQAWQANGKNNIYATILGRNRKLVANGSDIKGQYFMAYQQENNQKGQHYYKVVSFDGKTRGWIYKGGVDQTTTTTDESTPNGTYYLNNDSVKLTNAADGSVFHNKNGVALSHTELVKLDPFKVMKAVKVNNSGDTYYEVADQNQPTVTGWVKSSDVTTTKPFDASRDIKVNLTDQSGNVVKSFTVDTQNYDNKGGKVGTENGYNKVLNFDKSEPTLYTAVKTALTDNSSTNGGNILGTSFSLDSVFNSTFSGAQTGSDLQKENARALQYVEPGDTVNLKLSSGATNNARSRLTFSTLSSGTNSPESFGANDVDFPSLSDSEYANLSGQSAREHVDVGKIFSVDSSSPFSTVTKDDPNLKGGNFVTAPSSLRVLVGTKTFTSGTNGFVQNGALSNTSSSYTVFKNDQSALSEGNGDTVSFVNSGQKYHLVYVLNDAQSQHANDGKNYGDNLTSYYNVYAVAGSAMGGNTQNSTTNKNYLAE